MIEDEVCRNRRNRSLVTFTGGVGQQVEPVEAARVGEAGGIAQGVRRADDVAQVVIRVRRRTAQRVAQPGQVAERIIVHFDGTAQGIDRLLDRAVLVEVVIGPAAQRIDHRDEPAVATRDFHPAGTAVGVDGGELFQIVVLVERVRSVRVGDFPQGMRVVIRVADAQAVVAGDFEQVFAGGIIGVGRLAAVLVGGGIDPPGRVIGDSDGGDPVGMGERFQAALGIIAAGDPVGVGILDIVELPAGGEGVNRTAQFLEQIAASGPIGQRTVIARPGQVAAADARLKNPLRVRPG